MSDYDLSGPEVKGMLVAAGLFLCVAFGSVVSGSVSWTYLDYPTSGCWWSGTFSFVTAALGVYFYFSPVQCVVATACVLSIIALILNIVASAVTGLWYGIVDDLSSCYNSNTKESYGAGGTDAQNAKICGDSNVGWQCACVEDSSISGDYSCYKFTLKDGEDCNGILTTYPDMIRADLTFAILCVILGFIFSIFTCVLNCCSRRPTANHTTLRSSISNPPARGRSISYSHSHNNKSSSSEPVGIVMAAPPIVENPMLVKEDTQAAE